MTKKYTKGEKSKVLTRLDQVSDITLYAPTSEKCMDYLYDGLMMLCNHYVDDEDYNVFLKIPTIDFYNVALYVKKCCKEDDVIAKYIFAMVDIIRSFANLKYVSVVFKDDNELNDSYEKLIQNKISKDTTDIIEELANVYSIDALEIYFSDMFDQDVIDLINKHFILNGIISNSYLERDFLIIFKFDEYVSYMNMFIENNIDRLNMYDGDIVDYLRIFPIIIGDKYKPNIKLYTNYREV